MIERVLSGGQSGADQAAWRAAKRCGIPCSGWMPRGFLTEDGSRPEFAALYGAQEHASRFYPPRTKANVRAADFTLIFDRSESRELMGMSNGTRIAINAALDAGLPSAVAKIILGRPIPSYRPAAMARRLEELGVRTLNVGGNRESSAPGIGAWVERYLVEVFRLMGHAPSEDEP